MQDEQEQKMNGQEQTQATEPTEKPAEEAKAPEPEHDAVTPGGVCSKCGWTWGDPVKGIQPHIVYFGATRQEPEPPVVPPPVGLKKEPGPNACDAVSVDATCAKCGWNYAEEMKKAAPAPHPVL